MKTYDVVVIGGGVVGAACARAAALRGLTVAVFEPGPEPGAASPASAGMLAAQIEPGPDDSLSLAVRARDLYHPLAPALRETTAIDIHLWQSGIASLAFDEAAEHGLKDAVAAQRQAGLRCDWLGPDEVRERWPGAADDCRGALFAPEDGALDPQALARACLADARRLGATLLAEPVQSVAVADGRATGVVSPQGSTAAGHVVVAAGAWSKAIGALPRPPAVEPVRGQMAATAWPAEMPAAILYNEHCYVLARGGEALLGSTMEHAGFDCRVTNEGLAQIFRGAIRLFPGLLREPVLRMWAGLRPLTADGRPIVGAHPGVERLWYATGHGRNGVLLAALTGEIVGDLLSAGETAVDVAAWRPDRPGALAA
ncbi:MAG: glycine oxidase ThiO [Gemmatimonadetes bacterium]|nr:MAG: glycine oxidase ThiO [Gemmatimonadota bacterium]PYP31530.1 MAG: glycine oxidase ThiO [Gemmatimonadota bacterium]